MAMIDPTDVIRVILAKHGKLTVDAVGLAADRSLYSVGLSSHASVNVMLAIEDQFDIEFPEHLLARSTFESIASLHAAVAGLVGSEV
jgi:acyl carrier protein